MRDATRRFALRRLGRLGVLAGSGLGLAPLVAQESAWPSKPIRLIVPFNVGTPPDVAARLLAQAMSPELGQTIFVDNRPGAIGIVGLKELDRLPADGHTLYSLSMPVTTAPALMPGQKIDLMHHIDPVGQIDWTYSVLVVHRELPVRNIAELTALLRSRPNELSFASGGNGTPAHLAAEVFKAQRKVTAVHVPYAQFSQAIADLIGNRVQFMFMTSNVAVPQVQAGKMRALAVVGTQRLRALPDVPTMAEEGMGGFDTRSWSGIVVKAGTPRGVVDRLNREVLRVLGLSDVSERFAELGMAPAPGTPQQFGELIRREIDRWGVVIRAAHITAQ